MREQTIKTNCKPNPAQMGESSADFLEFAQAWIDRQWAEGRAEKTVVNYQMLFKHYLAPALGGMQLDGMGAEVIGQIESCARKQGASSRRMNQALLLLKEIFKSAIAAGHLKQNPLQSVTRKVFKRRECDYWTPEQAETFLAVNRDDRYWPAYALGLYTGMSIGELLGLCWDKVDLKAKTLEVARMRGDNSVRESGGYLRPRMLPLGPESVEILSRLSQTKRHPQFVITGPVPEKLPRLSRITHICFERATKRAGIPQIHFRDLRTSFVYRFLLEGGDIATLAELLGYSLERTMQKYAFLHALFWPRRESREGGSSNLWRG